MNHIGRIFLILNLSLFDIFITTISAQEKSLDLEYPKVGYQCPDFIIRNIQDYSLQSTRVSAFKGKWAVLDFWNVTCSACISSFPQVNEEAKHFGDKVQFMLIGREDSQNKIRSLYNFVKGRFNLNLPSAFDSSLQNSLDVGPCPYIIVLDNNGIVRAITEYLTEEHLNQLMAGSYPNIDHAYRRNEIRRDITNIVDELPFLVRGNGTKDSSVLFRSGSVISVWNKNMKQEEPINISTQLRETGKFEIFGVPLYGLYNYAFTGMNNASGGKPTDPEYGVFYPYPYFETKDTNIFQFDYYSSKGENIFNYSYVPIGNDLSEKACMQTMQKDLEKCFGYKASLEDRYMPCYFLRIDTSVRKKIRSKGDSSFVKRRADQLEIRNKPISVLLSIIPRRYPPRPFRFYDQTGIIGNIDLKLNCVMGNFEDVKKALESQGLYLVLGSKLTKVVVLRDHTTVGISAMEISK